MAADDVADFEFDKVEVDETLSNSTKSVASGVDSGSTKERSYHNFAESVYPLPNDEAEQKRLELQHRIWQLSLRDHSHLAPLSCSPLSALDIGCGPGMWVLDFAHQYPDCKVTGMDLSSTWPDQSQIPANAEFKVGDFVARWTYLHRFDYIHSRAVGTGIKLWATLLHRCFENLEPGGWREFQEFQFPLITDDDTLELCPAFKSWALTWAMGMSKVGTNIDSVLQVPEMLRERGLLNVTHKSGKWPMGPWASKQGTRLDSEKQLGEMMEVVSDYLRMPKY
ncbi:hypothetical protein LTR62_001587 [Meristemomyces frigidus]|uniref:S-adenosyl-L-methionine-dependent methyltransferase n=1 Tax=Meristemomyces frigidus TaxID=1508187 RepID=A0AAN7TFN2_9PEZI|nr:hypothetical protein LTR62_001587 [Meristemomyces frigidus]